MDRAQPRNAAHGDLLVALLLAVVLSAGWAWRDWANLSTLHLPDTDDVMRLQQIRDWLGGQAFGDLMQHRLGGGVAMHWSRLADLVPGALIAALTPLLGAHDAELAAVIAWPAMLFAAALALTASIARVLGGPIARTAIVVAAIAYPSTTIFLPGRIDHHGLQIVLLLVGLRALAGPARIASGLVAGLAAAAGLVVGMETAPLVAAAGGAIALAWIARRPGEELRLMGLGVGLGAGLLAASIVFRTWQWTYPACDGFTATAFRAAMPAAFAPMALTFLTRDTMPIATRALLAAGVGAVAVGAVAWLAPACLHPYGAVDPLLARLWLARVGEAQPLAAAPLSVAIGYAGVMIAGIVASAWQVRATSNARWAGLLIVQFAALALTGWQLRGAYAGAILAAPGLAAAITAARARGTGWLAAAWLGSAGMLYPLAAGALIRTPGGMSTGPAPADCTGRDSIATLASLPPGRLIAPLDPGAYALAATRLDLVGAPYHRNDAGNLATYRFFLGDADQAGAIARTWHVAYVALCPAGFGGLPLGAIAPMSLQARLARGEAPRWLVPISRSGLIVYRVEPRLLDATRTR